MHQRVSVNSLCFKGAPYAEQEAWWREIAPRKIGFVTPEIFKEGEALAQAIVERGNYGVATLSHPFRMGVLPERETEWPELQDSLSRAIAFARSVQAESIYMVTGGRGRLHWEAAAEIFCAAIAPNVAEARAAGVKLVIEPAPFFYAGNHIAHSLHDTIRLAEMAGIGVCIDVFSCWAEAGLKKMIERAAPITHLVQLGDFTLGDTSFPGRTVPGDGDIPLTDIIGWILGAGYEGAFDLELLGPRIWNEGIVQATGRAAHWVSDTLEKLGA